MLHAPTWGPTLAVAVNQKILHDNSLWHAFEVKMLSICMGFLMQVGISGPF
jgi:hypothetical protein